MIKKIFVTIINESYAGGGGDGNDYGYNDEDKIRKGNMIGDVCHNMRLMTTEWFSSYRFSTNHTRLFTREQALMILAVTAEMTVIAMMMTKL